MRLMGSILFGLIVVLGVSGIACCSSQEDSQDVVYLKNGEIVRGTIIEQILGESLKIKAADGSVLEYRMEEVERITKEANPNPEVTVNKKNPRLAFLWSFLVPGGGQFYNDEGGKAALMFAGASLGVFYIYSKDNRSLGGSESTGIKAAALLALSCSLWSIIDAPISASRINRENGLTYAPPPDDRLQVGVGMLVIDRERVPGVALSLHF